MDPQPLKHFIQRPSHGKADKLCELSHRSTNPILENPIQRDCDCPNARVSDTYSHLGRSSQGGLIAAEACDAECTQSYVNSPYREFGSRAEAELQQGALARFAESYALRGICNEDASTATLAAIRITVFPTVAGRHRRLLSLQIGVEL